MKFQTALNRSAKDDIIYVSIGSSLLNKTPKKEKMRTQQYPKLLEEKGEKGKRVSIILIDPVWMQPNKSPAVFESSIDGMFKSKTKDTFYPFLKSSSRSDDGRVVIRKVADFFTTSDEAVLVNFIKKNTKKEIIVGDFLVTGPFDPFSQEGTKKLGAVVKQASNARYMSSVDKEILKSK